MNMAITGDPAGMSNDIGLVPLAGEMAVEMHRAFRSWDLVIKMCQLIAEDVECQIEAGSYSINAERDQAPSKESVKWGKTGHYGEE